MCWFCACAYCIPVNGYITSLFGNSSILLLTVYYMRQLYTPFTFSCFQILNYYLQALVNCGSTRQSHIRSSALFEAKIYLEEKRFKYLTKNNCSMSRTSYRDLSYFSLSSSNNPRPVWEVCGVSPSPQSHWSALWSCRAIGVARELRRGQTTRT